MELEFRLARIPKARFLIILLAAALIGIGLLPSLSTLYAENEETACYRAATGLAAPADSPDYRKYARDRNVQISHLALDVTPDFYQRTVAGQVTLTFKPIAKPLEELRLDAVDLKIASVESTEKIRGYQVTDTEIVINFEAPIPADKEVKVTVKYSAQPARGLYFRTPEMGYKPGETHLWSQGETDEARHWYPSYDYPNQKFTTEVTCRVPTGMSVMSNGRMVSSEVDSATGLQVVHWAQEKPHSNYLLSLIAGNFEKVTGQHGTVPLEFYTLPSEIKQATNSFASTKETMAFFEQEIGVPFPWAKYAQVCINDFHFGGMENTSITTLTDRTLHTADTENIQSSEPLVAHEMAHQWFGDLVTCKDWSQVWLNEGFASFYTHLFLGHKYGPDEKLYGLYNDAQAILRQTNETRGIVWRKYGDSEEMFNYLAYPKGSWVLNMLRNQLGENLYRRCIKTYLERNQFRSVTTEDLNKVIEELSGRSFDQFFDQWVYHGQQPQIDVAYSWDEKAKLAKVSIKQVQKISEDVLLFNFPLTIRFKSKFGTVDDEITVKEKEEDFYFSLKDAPEIVRIDPQLAVLMKVNFKPANGMLYSQLADQGDVIGRLIAAEALGEKKEHDAVAKLKATLNGDSFHGVRSKAADALRGIHTDEALEALIASVDQSDAQVRLAVVDAIGGFYHPSAFAALRRALDGEKNPAIAASVIRALGAYHRPEIRDLLLKYLAIESYHNRLSEAAIAAMRAQDDSRYLAPLRKSIESSEAAFTTPGLVSGLDSLAWLARNETDREATREFIEGFVNSKKDAVRRGALTALGTLGDPKAIAVLEKFTALDKQRPEAQAAEKALTAIRDGRKSGENVKELRDEVLDLQKSNRDLKKQMEDLKKKIEAAGAKDKAQ